MTSVSPTTSRSLEAHEEEVPIAHTTGRANAPLSGPAKWSASAPQRTMANAITTKSARRTRAVAVDGSEARVAAATPPVDGVPFHASGFGTTM